MLSETFRIAVKTILVDSYITYLYFIHLLLVRGWLVKSDCPAGRPVDN